jgi:hypothetical protein
LNIPFRKGSADRYGSSLMIAILMDAAAAAQTVCKRPPTERGLLKCPLLFYRIEDLDVGNASGNGVATERMSLGSDLGSISTCPWLPRSYLSSKVESFSRGDRLLGLGDQRIPNRLTRQPPRLRVPIAPARRTGCSFWEG